jgi:hypothetical protein
MAILLSPSPAYLGLQVCTTVSDHKENIVKGTYIKHNKKETGLMTVIGFFLGDGWMVLEFELRASHLSHTSSPVVVTLVVNLTEMRDT